MSEMTWMEAINSSNFYKLLKTSDISVIGGVI